MARILITGGTGFIGQHLLERLSISNSIIAPVRREPEKAVAGVNYAIVDDLLNVDSWSNLLLGVDVVIHCAAIAISLNSNQMVDDFDAINVTLTKKLADAASDAHVKQFVFLSSIKAIEPNDKYSRSKSSAERLLRTLSNDLPLTIIRPCMVYGFGSKGSITSLTKVLKKGWPLPFRSLTKNKRNILYIDNLIDFIELSVNEKHVGEFNIANLDPVSTYSMTKALKRGSGSSSLIVPMPIWCFSLLGKVTKKQEVVSRLIGDLQADMTATLRQTGWKPKYDSIESLEQTAQLSKSRDTYKESA